MWDCVTLPRLIRMGITQWERDTFCTYLTYATTVHQL